MKLEYITLIVCKETDENDALDTAMTLVEYAKSRQWRLVEGRITHVISGGPDDVLSAIEKRTTNPN